MLHVRGLPTQIGNYIQFRLGHTNNQMHTYLCSYFRLPYALVLKLLQVHALQGCCPSGSNSCQGILKSMLVVCIEGFSFSPANKLQTSTSPAQLTCSVCLLGSPT